MTLLPHLVQDEARIWRVAEIVGPGNLIRSRHLQPYCVRRVADGPRDDAIVRDTQSPSATAAIEKFDVIAFDVQHGGAVGGYRRQPLPVPILQLRHAGGGSKDAQKNGGQAGLESLSHPFIRNASEQQLDAILGLHGPREYLLRADAKIDLSPAGDCRLDCIEAARFSKYYLHQRQVSLGKFRAAARSDLLFARHRSPSPMLKGDDWRFRPGQKSLAARCGK
jgi:hypothetical protein